MVGEPRAEAGIHPRPFHSCRLPRRGFLAGAAALGAAPLARAAPAPRSAVDVHAHYVSPAYLKALGGPLQSMAGWSLAAHLDAMDQGGVARSILSVTSPAIPFPGEEGRRVAREINEYGARLVADHRSRLGMFAALPIMDMDGALGEAEYALDVLKANGVGLLTSYGGKWLGDPMFDPLFELLNRRRAVVYVHPVSPACCTALQPFIGDASIEFGTDTTRAITSYIYRGAAHRFPDVRMIWSHAGGTMPYLIERFDVQDRSQEKLRLAAPGGYRAAAGRFFYDTAQAANSVAMGGLRQVVPTERIVFGSDFPFRSPGEQLDQLDRLQPQGVFSAAELRAILHGNVGRGLPELLA